MEVDETYLGGVEKGMRGRQTTKKALILVAAQKDGQGIGRVRMRRLADTSSASLMPFVQDSIEPGSVVHTDAWLDYEPLGKSGPLFDTKRNLRLIYCHAFIESFRC